MRPVFPKELVPQLWQYLEPSEIRRLQQVGEFYLQPTSVEELHHQYGDRTLKQLIRRQDLVGLRYVLERTSFSEISDMYILALEASEEITEIFLKIFEEKEFIFARTLLPLIRFGYLRLLKHYVGKLGEIPTSAVRMAVHYEQVEVLDYLLSHEPSIGLLNEAILVAKSLIMVDRLVKAGANVNISAKYFYDRVDIFKYFIEHGLRNLDNHLFVALRGDYFEVMKLLVSALGDAPLRSHFYYEIVLGTRNKQMIEWFGANFKHASINSAVRLI